MKNESSRICHDAHDGGGFKKMEIFAVPLTAAQRFVIIDNKYIRPKVHQGRGDRNKSQITLFFN